MIRRKPLGAAEEARLAERMHEVTIQLWVRLLSNPVILEDLLRRLGADAQSSPAYELAKELRQWRSAVVPKDSGETSARDNALAMAERLFELDRDGTQLGELTSLVASRASTLDDIERRTVSNLLGQLRVLRNIFIEANLALVMFAVRRHRRNAVATNDLFQEGCVGLMKAVDRFDYRRGNRFSTYALWWIRHAIGHLRWQSRPVRVPDHLLLAHERLARARAVLQTKLGRDPSAEEVSIATGIPLQTIDTVAIPGLDQTTWLSLDTSSRDDDRALSESLPFHGFGDDESMEQQVLVSEIADIIEELPDFEADVLRKRFALGYDRPATLQEIGREHGVTRERIRQIEARALEMLRQRIGNGASQPRERIIDEQENDHL